MNHIRDDIDKFFDFGISVPNKTMFLGTGNHNDEPGENDPGVTYVMSQKAIKGLFLLDQRNRKKQLTILMNNIGGDVYEGLAIFDAIKCCKSPTLIKVFGSAMSMGSVILQASKKRYLGPNATILLHYGTDEFTGHAKDLTMKANEGERLNQLLEDIYLERIREKRPKYTRQTLQELIKFDKYLSATEAVDLGLADKILR